MELVPLWKDRFVSPVFLLELMTQWEWEGVTDLCGFRQLSLTTYTVYIVAQYSYTEVLLKIQLQGVEFFFLHEIIILYYMNFL